MARRIGSQTLAFEKEICVASAGSVVGPIEGSGPLRHLFDAIVSDGDYAQCTFEKAETNMQLLSYGYALKKASMSEQEIDLFVGGDLLNQIVATSFAAREINRPYWGTYNACATFGESLQIGACALEAGAASRVMVSSSSHYATAERQYRTPLEQGVQSAVTAQRTVTGSGCALLREGGEGPRLSAITIGKVVDFGVSDLANMGTAMAPAAAMTILTHFEDTKTSFADYDLVLTGDLATVGYDICKKLIQSEGYADFENFNDCGRMIYETSHQSIVDSGGSGAGSSSSVFAAYVFPKLAAGELKRVMLVPTGALMSPLTSNQKETIPAIAHAIVFESRAGGVEN
ncbi:MAG: stage V sporulation protein AD [Eubacteriaceae bacterium]|jgi:stage V sporulation protein AD|nr:stage V sporulation protein AD [Eubacteriaceae bacterium]